MLQLYFLRCIGLPLHCGTISVILLKNKMFIMNLWRSKICIIKGHDIRLRWCRRWRWRLLDRYWMTSTYEVVSSNSVGMCRARTTSQCTWPIFSSHNLPNAGRDEIPQFADLHFSVKRTFGESYSEPLIGSKVLSNGRTGNFLRCSW